MILSSDTETTLTQFGLEVVIFIFKIGVIIKLRPIISPFTTDNKIAELDLAHKQYV